MPDIKTVLSLLSEQCTTAEELRHFFVKNGIKGWTTNFTQCPVANYLSRETAERWGVDDEYAEEVDYEYEKAAWPDVRRVWISEPLRDFVHNFDAGMYPDLVSSDDWYFWKNRNGERYEGNA